jgi:hypothetical protein
VDLPLYEALFAFRRDVRPRCELGRHKILFTVKMDVIWSSETSGFLTRTTRRHIPQDNILQGLLSAPNDINIPVQTVHIRTSGRKVSVDEVTVERP